MQETPKIPESSPEIPDEKKEEEIQEYDPKVYGLLLEVLGEDGKVSRVKHQKIGKYHKLPAEISYLFRELEKRGVEINKLEDEDLKEIMRLGPDIIDRKSEYDQELINKISPKELVRWRRGEKMKDETSFYKIVETLREHAVAERLRTKQEQKTPRGLKPQGEYHKKQNPFR